jgi:hypothetical protein
VTRGRWSLRPRGSLGRSRGRPRRRARRRGVVLRLPGLPYLLTTQGGHARNRAGRRPHVLAPIGEEIRVVGRWPMRRTDLHVPAAVRRVFIDRGACAFAATGREQLPPDPLVRLQRSPRDPAERLGAQDREPEDSITPNGGPAPAEPAGGGRKVLDPHRRVEPRSSAGIEPDPNRPIVIEGFIRPEADGDPPSARIAGPSGSSAGYQGPADSRMWDRSARRWGRCGYRCTGLRQKRAAFRGMSRPGRRR